MRAVCKHCSKLSWAKGLCHTHYNQMWRAHNPEYDKSWSDKNRVKIRKQKQLWVDKNSDYWRKLYSANPSKIKDRVRKYRKEHPEKVCAMRSKDGASRRAAHRLATPSWANHFFMEEAYRLSRLRTKITGIKWHVDHIVPLRSKIVCGFHVEQNLQVIPESMNASKQNRYWPEMP